MTIYYMGIEKYESRYSAQLTEWNTRVFDRRKIDYKIVAGEAIDDSEQIVTGQVLDAHGRSYYSLTQMANLVKLMRAGKITSKDVIYFEDMFTPGIESLPYIINQIPENLRPRVFVRCLAQTIDPDDFVHTWNMQPWMSKYENMVNDFATILASNEEMVANAKVAGWTAPIYNVSGLAFNIDEVQSRVDRIMPFNDRRMRVVFASRWDREKNPHFYMDLIEEYNRQYPRTVEFCICSGSVLRSNDESALKRARDLEDKEVLTIYENLSKNKYYDILNYSRVLINTAMQDWTSNTVSEADALGCNVLFPAYRSFPEIFSNDHERLYVPWSQEDAINKLHILLKKPHKNIGKISKWTDGTIDRILDIMSGNGEQYRRKSNDYRKYTIETKYT